MLINYTVSTLLCFTWVPPIYMRKPEIPVGKSNGSRHSVWEASENMGRDLMRCSFSTIFSLLSTFGYTL